MRRATRFGDGIGAPVAFAFLCLAGALAFVAGRYLLRATFKSTMTLPVEPARILHEDRNAYFIAIVLPGSDSNSWPSRSSLEILENGRPLAAPHSSHEEIRALGAGRYSHWTTGVYLSSSDDSDPRTNGRKYSIRYSDRPLAPGPIGHGVAILMSLAFAGAVVLNAGRLRRARDRIVGARSLRPSLVYALALTGILIAAALSRFVWTRTIQLPGVLPDSTSYLIPALQDPFFPLSEERPISVPYLISLSLAIFRHPFGILIAHAFLALSSAALLAVALRRRFGTPLTSLLVAIYVLFCAKNVIFEHLLLSEHLARCLYLLFIAVLLGFWNPASHWMTVFLALLSVAAILTKPSAIILVPVFLGWWLLTAGSGKSGRAKRRAQAAAIYLGVLGCLLGAYAYANRARFGFFGLSGMDGLVLYWHVHPLTRLDSGIYPQIKAEMRPALQEYLQKQAQTGDYDGDWAVHGRDDPLSPAAIVKAYAQGHGDGSLLRRENQIFKALALEAIRDRPGDYLILSLKGVRDLWNRGLNFWYGWQLLPFDPFPKVNENWARERPAWFRYQFSVSGRPWSASFDDDPNRRIRPASATLALPNLLSAVLTRGLRVMAWCGLLFGIIAVLGSTGSRLIGLVPCAGVVALYILFCGFTIPAEPPRYLAHVQDLIVAIPLIIIGVGVNGVLDVAKSEKRKTWREPEGNIAQDGERT